MKTIEPYLVDPINTRGLDEGFIASNVALDISKWETAAGVNILGDEIECIHTAVCFIPTEEFSEVINDEQFDEEILNIRTSENLMKIEKRCKISL